MATTAGAAGDSTFFLGLDLVVAMNWGNYDKTGGEQNRVNVAVLNDVVFPSLT